VKLSEAISLGAMLSPQAIGHFTDKNGGRCAWMSAVDAVGREPHVWGRFGEWTWARRPATCPVCQGRRRVSDTIIHLNDRHRWSRQRIAEWVAEIEPTADTSRDGGELSLTC